MTALPIWILALALVSCTQEEPPAPASVPTPEPPFKVLPPTPEERALLCLKPTPDGYVGQPESDKRVNVGKFTYRSHGCHKRGSELVCAACYNHPENYLGTLSVVVSIENAEEPCTLLWFGGEGPVTYKAYGVNPAYCETEGRDD